MPEPTQPQPGDFLPPEAVVVTHMAIGAAAVMSETGGSDAIVATFHGFTATGEPATATIVLPPEGVPRMAGQLLDSTTAYLARTGRPPAPAAAPAPAPEGGSPS